MRYLALYTMDRLVHNGDDFDGNLQDIKSRNSCVTTFAVSPNATRVGDWAAYKAIYLLSLDLSSSPLTEIGGHAFAYCKVRESENAFRRSSTILSHAHTPSFVSSLRSWLRFARPSNMCGCR